MCRMHTPIDETPVTPLPRSMLLFHRKLQKKESTMPKKVGFQAFLGTNYGTVLQSFALYQTIKNLGYECEIIGCDEFRHRKEPDPSLKISNPKEYDKLLMQKNFENGVAYRHRYRKLGPMLFCLPKTRCPNFLANSVIINREVEAIRGGVL